jgi:two component transcriptional regulator, winged helix family
MILTGLLVSNSAPMITSPNRSTRARWWRGCGLFCGAPAADHRAPPVILEVGRLRLDLDRHEARVADRTINLTPTEFDLLRILLSHPGHAFTRRELIEQGPGYDYEGMERTIDSHIKNLRRKLDAASAGVRIETVYGVGYRLAVVV